MLVKTTPPNKYFLEEENKLGKKNIDLTKYSLASDKQKA